MRRKKYRKEGMELGKVPSSTEKEKHRKKPKQEEGDRLGRDQKGKQKRKKKNRPEKTEETGSASTGERQHQQFSQQERHT